MLNRLARAERNTQQFKKDTEQHKKDLEQCKREVEHQREEEQSSKDVKQCRTELGQLRGEFEQSQKDLQQSVSEGVQCKQDLEKLKSTSLKLQKQVRCNALVSVFECTQHESGRYGKELVQLKSLSPKGQNPILIDTTRYRDTHTQSHTHTCVHILPDENTAFLSCPTRVRISPSVLHARRMVRDLPAVKQSVCHAWDVSCIRGPLFPSNTSAYWPLLSSWMELVTWAPTAILGTMA
eukprot:1150847-Pelagomonas_calceolata.AAC.5